MGLFSGMGSMVGGAVGDAASGITILAPLESNLGAINGTVIGTLPFPAQTGGGIGGIGAVGDAASPDATSILDSIPAVVWVIIIIAIVVLVVMAFSGKDQNVYIPNKNVPRTAYFGAPPQVYYQRPY